MTQALTSPNPDPETPDKPDAEFGTSVENFPAARVGDTVYAMVPGRGNAFFLASAWRINRPLGELRRGDFYGHGGTLPDEAAFRAKVLEQAEHAKELRTLNRREFHSRETTPWGLSQGATAYAEGVVFHSAASHGGFHLSEERNTLVDHRLLRHNGWYEEDAEWAIVALTFPNLFTSLERRSADQTVKDTWPDAWEAIKGTILEPGQSFEKDRRAFHNRHAEDWIVVSAIRSDHHPGYVETIATRAGTRGPSVEERRFLVPIADYDPRRFGFVIDPMQHGVYDGPSSFVGWRR
jgi:hypothetical protein